MPPPRKFPRELQTLGDHLRKARLERGLWQEHVARELGVAVGTLLNWERNHTRVQTRFMPKVMAFLGYDPREETGRLGDRIRALRERQASRRWAWPRSSASTPRPSLLGSVVGYG